jgi:hypothetical protein
MKDPVPTALNANEFERSLLDAGKREQIPRELKLHMAQALSAPATPAAFSRGSRRWLLSSKPASWLVLSGLVLGAAAGWRQLNTPKRALRTASVPRLETRLVTDPAAMSNSAPRAAQVAAASGVTQASAVPSAVNARARANSLGDEIALLDRASAALQQRAADQALGLLQVYARRFPRGRLVPEAEALQIEALGLQGDATRASEAAGHFLHAYPQHPLSQRVQRWVATKAH